MFKAAFTILAVAGLFAHGGKPGDPVATVDGQAIVRRDFDHWMAVSAKGDGSVVPDRATGYRRCIAAKRKAKPKVIRRQLATECQQDFARLRDQVMELLLSFKWIDGEAAAQNVTVTDAEVTQSFQEEKRQNFPDDADFRQYLKRSGQTEQDIVRRVRLDLLSSKLRDKVVASTPPVTDQAIAQFYAENRSRFAVPEKRALRAVLTNREADAKRARSALERGASWKAVAKRYSIDPVSRRDGGRLPAMAKGTFDRQFEKAVFSAAEHRLVGPVRTHYGYWVFTVTRIEPARQPSLAEVSDTIRRRSSPRPSRPRSTPSCRTSRRAGGRRPSARRDT